VGVVNPIGTDGAGSFSLELSAEWRSFDEVGHRHFGVWSSSSARIGEAVLDGGDGGFDWLLPGALWPGLRRER